MSENHKNSTADTNAEDDEEIMDESPSVVRDVQQPNEADPIASSTQGQFRIPMPPQSSSGVPQNFRDPSVKPAVYEYGDTIHEVLAIDGDSEPNEDNLPIVDLNYHEDLAQSHSNLADTKFDVTIGYIEDIIMEDEFRNLQTTFFEKYYEEFDDSEENKFCYTDIHKEYVDLIESFLDDRLKGVIDDFSMSTFMHQLESRKDELEGEIFEMLLAFCDFLSFKELMLDYKMDKQGGNTFDATSSIIVTRMSYQ